MAAEKAAREQWSQSIRNDGSGFCISNQILSYKLGILT